MQIPINLNDLEVKDLHKNPNEEKPHWHCQICWKEEWFFFNWTKVCKKCYEENAEYRDMILCTPIVCASS
jgi:hypothetical protein